MRNSVLGQIFYVGDCTEACGPSTPAPINHNCKTCRPEVLAFFSRAEGSQS